MSIRPGQIYFAKNAQLGKAQYARPCLVMRVSSENFAIYEGDPGFKETGLSESSYLVSSHGVPVKWTFFDQVKLLGELIPELNDRVGDWWGEPI